MKLTILLIEDNLDVRETTADILELAGYAVLKAENGKEGVRLAKEELPDLIVCDIMMPELDGYGVLHILSKKPDTASIPFIFLTAKSEKEDFRKGMTLGADDYITKPFDETDLLEAIEHRLKKTALLRQQYSKDKAGLDSFIATAQKVGNLSELAIDRKTIQFKNKEIIYREGDLPNRMYYLNSGKVKTYRINDDGKELITGLHAAGDFIGYMPILQEGNYQEWASCLENTELSIIPKQDFLDLLYQDRDVAHKLMKILSNNLVEKEEKLIQIAYDTVRKRVADALLKLQDKYSIQGEEDFSISFSRDDLARIAGTAKETTIRALSDLKEEGLVKLKGSEITIIDAQALSNLTY